MWSETVKGVSLSISRDEFKKQLGHNGTLSLDQYVEVKYKSPFKIAVYLHKFKECKNLVSNFYYHNLYQWY